MNTNQFTELKEYLGRQFAYIDERFDLLIQRIDFNEQYTHERFDKVDNHLMGIENRLSRVEDRLDSVESRLDSVEDRLDTLEGAVDSLAGDVRDMALEIAAGNSHFGRHDRQIEQLANHAKLTLIA